MKTVFNFSIILLLINTLAIAQNEIQTDRIIIKYKHEAGKHPTSICDPNSTGISTIDKINEKFNFSKIERVYSGRQSSSRIFSVQFPPETNLESVMEAYYRSGEIEYAELDHVGWAGGLQGVSPDDAFYFRQWALKNEGNNPHSTSLAGADIDMENAWAVQQGDSNIVVCIIDSGVKLDHPEFAGRIWKNHNEIAGNLLDDDGNGFIDDNQGWDFANMDNLPIDDQGHGTNVTGIIGANGNNKIGYAGVDWNCKLMALKGLDNGNLGFYSWWAAALYYAADNGADVINMSLGGTGASNTLQDAINYALDQGVIIVACMMNKNSSTVHYPAAYNRVIAVGSTDPDDTRTSPFFWDTTSGSCFGNHISVVAPGNFIYGLSANSNTNYNSYWGGTSQATPYVAGLVSLLLAQNPLANAAQIKAMIEETAEDQVGDPAEDKPGWDPYYGHGRINAYSALSLLNKAEEFDFQQDLVRIFPNPSSQYFKVSFPFGTTQIKIFNSMGQCVLIQNSVKGTEHDFNLTGNGIYYVQVTKGNASIVKKLIIAGK